MEQKEKQNGRLTYFLVMTGYTISRYRKEHNAESSLSFCETKHFLHNNGLQKRLHLKKKKNLSLENGFAIFSLSKRNLNLPHQT